MFKHSLTAAAIVATMTLASCSSDDFANAPVADGSETTVTIKATLPADMGSRAYSDGFSATSLKYGVYEGGALKFTDAASFNGSLSTEVTLTLVAGKTYDVLFWAEAEGITPYTLNWDSKQVTVSYDGAVANDETRDAFYGKIIGIEAGKVATAEATLTRPFAQVNVGTDDLTGYLNAEGEGASVKTKMVITNAFSTLNLLDGTASDATPATFDYAAPATDEVFPVAHQTQGKSYSYMAMAYVLQGNAADTPNAKVEIIFNDGTKDFNTVTVDNAPVRQNFRTNIYGSLLTTSVTATVTINPIYNTPDFNEKWDGSVEQPIIDATGNASIANGAQLAGLGELISSGNSFSGKTITLENDIDMGNIPFIPLGGEGNKHFMGTFDGNGKTITNLVVNRFANYGNALFYSIANDAVVKNLVIENAEIHCPAPNDLYGNFYGIVTGYAYGNITMENVTVRNCMVSGYGKVGILIGGTAERSGITKIINCTVENCEVGGSYNCGGLIGLAQNPVEITNTTPKNVTWTPSRWDVSDDKYHTLNYPGVKSIYHDTNTFDVEGEYWLYSNYYYAAWGDLYTYFTYSQGTTPDEYSLYTNEAGTTYYGYGLNKNLD